MSAPPPPGSRGGPCGRAEPPVGPAITALRGLIAGDVVGAPYERRPVARLDFALEDEARWQRVTDGRPDGTPRPTRPGPPASRRRWREGYAFDVSAAGSVPHAIRAFLETDSVEAAIRPAVWMGGDADTMGAIAGALAASVPGATLGPALEALVTRCLPKPLGAELEVFAQWVADRARLHGTAPSLRRSPGRA